MSETQKSSSIDLVRKAIARIRLLIPIGNWCRKFKAYYYFRDARIQMGRNVRVYGLPAKIKTGEDIVLYDNTVFEFGHESELSIGDHAVVSYGALLCCRKKISIGNNVLIGEYCSVRDSTHDYTEQGRPMRENKDIADEIIIGNNVWIGRGCIILPGTVIEDGVVIGANSVVKGQLQQNGIYAGAPCRFIKSRV